MSGVSAVARIRAAPDGRGGTALRELAGDGPLALRRSRHPQDERAAHVVLVGAMAGPLGGDRLRIVVTVDPGARLLVTSAAATLSLPGREPAPAHYELDLTVGEDAELVWHPEPVIAAAGSDLRLWTRLRLAPGARVSLREEQVLGRHAEPPGRLASRLTVRRAERLLLDQSTDVGPGAPPGWDGPAVLAGNRALGQLLTTSPCRPHPPHGSALLPLAPDLTLATALAPDALTLRTALACVEAAHAAAPGHACPPRSRVRAKRTSGAPAPCGRMAP
ncbi:urease accessory protein UreD [Streptacidiphilus jiangxiensis]|uniref:Urease accessory protein UreD n=1 Tax=Streptacidiphilus jiangxiensis TaxID=235985 RepID=A0A1H7QW75_STRJI|nr:urease accessory protein UreD [Streptacidiphilus jiangxiensis]SEL52129.1 urease accessory protein [Streptacidiphilus jiangxiensis]